MAITTAKQILWGLGLSEEQAREVRALAGTGYVLRTWAADALTDPLSAGDADAPGLICFSLAGCRAFAARPVSQTGHLELVPKMLLLEENAGREVLEEALDFGEAEIVRPPMTEKRLASCLRRATEAAALHRDMRNMVREIFLNRELLEHKSHTLHFLVNFLTETAGFFSEAEILGRACVCLRHLFPVLGLHAILFGEDGEEAIRAKMYLSMPDNHAARREWQDLLLANARSVCSEKSLRPFTVQPVQPDAAHKMPRPGDSNILTLPLVLGSEILGVMLLVAGTDRILGRDEALALDSALRHLALGLKNARFSRRFPCDADRSAECRAAKNDY